MIDLVVCSLFVFSSVEFLLLLYLALLGHLGTLVLSGQLFFIYFSIYHWKRINLVAPHDTVFYFLFRHNAAALSNMSTSSSVKVHPSDPATCSASLGLFTSTTGTPPLAIT
mmetsp:Transcript_7427/g.15496  ORF Transcript_7427/g.15496 Transcript_7427/m.15496 type:complete len:111 (-) Transcript_7427:1386-1718(-)